MKPQAVRHMGSQFAGGSRILLRKYFEANNYSVMRMRSTLRVGVLRIQQYFEVVFLCNHTNLRDQLGFHGVL